MNFIKNLKIRDKLIMLLSLLLIPLIFFVYASIRFQIEENDKLENEIVKLEESERISDFIHAFQKERARILAASEGELVYLLEAKNQRSYTDDTKRELEAFAERTGRRIPNLAAVNNLDNYRNDLDNNRLDVIAFRQYSTNLIFNFLERVDANVIQTNNPALSMQLSSFQNLIEAKIQLGRIRSFLMRVMHNEQLSYEDFASITSQREFYERAINEFVLNGDKAHVQKVLEILETTNYKATAGVLEQIRQNPQVKLNSYNAVTVFNQFSESIEALNAVEKSLIATIRNKADEESKRMQISMVIISVTMVVVLLLTSLLSYYIISLIASSLSALRVAADRIRVGATDVTIRIDSKDEIGEVAESFRGVLQKNVYLSDVARAIGEGNYNLDVEVQSPEDVLSYSIKDMKENLQRFTEDNERRSWVLTGVSDLNNLITGENALHSMAEKVISFLCAYTGSEAGIMYLHHDNGSLTPAAMYGVDQSLEQLPEFKIGTGMVGQAVSENQIKVLDNVEDNYLKIKTGLSEIDPASIMIIPLQFSSTIVGAIELCSRRVYSQTHEQFFKTIAERVSIIIHTLKAHLQTQELLYETQNQAEELETQQEELRQLNAELKASEEELRVSQEELQEKNSELEEKAQLLEEQYEELRGKNKALEDAREAIELKMQQVETVSKYKSDFLANMSHELRTPLNSILILSRLLSDNPDQTLTAKQIDHAQIIHNSGNDLLKLINEILDLSKIESGMIKLELEQIRLRDISMEPLFGEMAAKKDIRFREHYQLNGYNTITTDRFRLEQILKNFIGNAIKFTEPGGEVELSVYAVENKPRFSSEKLREQAEVIAFEVRDTGIGIPKDKQSLIFEAFQQADTSTTRKYGGTGLGLTISRELAALLGGELMLESEPGRGSTFTLYLPIDLQQEIRKAPAKPAESVPEYKPKASSINQMFERMETKEKKEIVVLIIEDDKGFSDILADFALAKKFKVHQAYSGAEGLQIARTAQPDAILLDIHLPDTTGWDVLREIREDKELRHVSVHVMSAYDKDVTGDYHDNDEYLPKPVTLEMLNKAFSSIAAISDRSIENILIVEDNEVENKAVAELLLAHGLHSTAAYSAEEAERVLAKQKIDCIILDLNLPGMKGYDWMKAIKSKKGLLDIPIIIYSGKDLSEQEETQLKEFANTIIIKNEYSYLRLLDEVQLFLHKVNQKLPSSEQDFKMKLHVPEEILQGKKVLVADDDVRNIYSLSSLLELHGMQVVAAYDGKEALEKLQQETGVDMVLMDIMMPEMDGIETIKRIRDEIRFRKLPIIALTAKAMKEDKEKCLQAGASDYIPKPVDTDKLLTLMRVWLYEA
ncbi:response regulator [Pontibacter sp. SGAir0037]|uniref:response regulator n=1 Tax=Pontibacter sp. SGAir0037 TaxID=2571030 RepID=UPI0010CCE612|nr:response regulator [Pontibacter sp. SGAir0037]QCR22075.1 hybrid sensor histidine kinase/response regulator [Pontibacter sp. SGAir0037]